MEHEIAETFFNDPVDPDALGIPEYRDIIKARPQPCHHTPALSNMGLLYMRLESDHHECMHAAVALL